MDVAWNPWVVPSALVMVGAALMAGVVHFTRPERAQNRRLALFLFMEGCVFLWLSVGQLTVASERTAYAVFATGYVTWPWVMAAYLRFLSTLRTPLTAPLRSRGLDAAVLVLASAASLGALARPDLWFTGFVRPWFGGLGMHPSLLSRALFASASIISVFALVAAASAFRRAPSGSLARQQAGAFVAAFGIRDAAMVLFGIAALSAGAALGQGGPRPGAYVLLLVWPLAVSCFHVLLVYGILRTQLFDIDLKIKWTLNKSTLAAVFIALFFVASESAAAFLGDRWGTYVGILAAGLLVFALAPLQRLADRVSDAAMPHVQDTEEYRTVRKREVYRAAVESALQDGMITEKERDVLATLADELGLSAGEARAIERDTTGLPLREGTA